MILRDPKVTLLDFLISLKLHMPQVVPVKPGKQEQLYEHVGSLMLHRPPFKHGDEIH